MSLNDNVKQIIKYVVQNDLQAAKFYVKCVLENEKTKKNENFCNSMLTKLSIPENNMIELPYDLKPILKMEDVSISFNPERYYLTERENNILEQIITAKEVNLQLSEMKIHYLNSTLLYGESGTGKTTFGRYAAYKLGVSFAYLNFAHCISSYLGSTSKNIEKAFDYVKKTNCVFMLDEIDAIGLKRGKEDVGEMSRIVISLMQSLDMLENDVIVIGATNRLDVIDEALTRRFSIKHEVKQLSNVETNQLVINFLNDAGIKYDIENINKYSTINHKQSDIVNDITLGIVRMLKNNEMFNLFV